MGLWFTGLSQVAAYGLDQHYLCTSSSPFPLLRFSTYPSALPCQRCFGMMELFPRLPENTTFPTIPTILRLSSTPCQSVLASKCRTAKQVNLTDPPTEYFLCINSNVSDLRCLPNLKERSLPVMMLSCPDTCPIL